jgi:hypothetical protein
MIRVVTEREHTFDVYGAGDVGVRLDARSGALVGLVERHDPSSLTALSIAVTAVWGGGEVPGPVGGLEYPDAQRRELSDLTLVGSRSEDRGDADRFVVTARDGDWELDLHYDLHDRAPQVAVGVTIRRAEDGSAELLRDLELGFRVPLDDPNRWLLNAPGNQMRSDIMVGAVAAPLRIFGAAATHGGPAVVALTDPTRPTTTVVWPLSTTEMGAGELLPGPDGVTFLLRTDLAGTVDHRCGLTWGAVHLGAQSSSWPGVRDQLAGWYGARGFTGPAGRPEWIRRAHIYEAHIGFSVFADGRHYQRYETPRGLQDDLSRIQDLGFDVIQLMPRHPYPSYNVHDYADVTTTYGDEQQLRELVDECHRRGMRVLLDIIVHGVIDQEVMDATLASVNAGPYSGRLADGTLDYLADTAEDVAWARHIVEYAPYWREGSPPRHPLADERPEWFMRDSGGAITRRYTKAFDIANPSWQRYFVDACLDLTRRLGTDGFRVDAPTYNNFATWAAGRARRASYGPMASLPLLRDLQVALRALRPDAAVYTEPGGALFRATADMTYNYDEHWLVESLLADRNHPQRDWRMVRNGRELARWLMDRDLADPAASGIVHHVDSHDSIWWRLPGAQWRRERFGPEATVALVAVFALGMPGAFMTFMGGEEQIETELRRAHDLRRRLPELASGTCEYLPAAASSDEVLVARRRLVDDESLVLVNLASEAVECEIALGASVGNAPYDLWNEEHCAAGTDGAMRLSLGPYQPRVLRLT